VSEWETACVTRNVLEEPELPTRKAIADAGMRIVLAVPMERTIQQEAFFGFMRLAVQGWPFIELPYTRNDIARYRFAQHLLKSEFTHLLMLDSDHRHPPDIVHRLARWMLAYEGIDVIGGLNFRRGEPYDPCAFIWDNGFYRRLAEWVPGAFPVDALGTGSMLVSRKVFETIPPPWFDYKYEDLEGFPGTDMSFAKYCKQYGISQWVDTTTTSPHLGTQMIGAEEYRQFLLSHGAEVK